VSNDSNPKDDAGATSDPKSVAHARRLFTQLRVKEGFTVTYKDLEAEGFKPASQSLINDGAYFEARPQLGVKRVKNQFVPIGYSEAAAWVFAERRITERKRKENLGELAAEVLWGRRLDWDACLSPPSGQKKAATSDATRTQIQIIRYLLRCRNTPSLTSFAPRIDRMIEYLKSYWEKMHRVVCLDAGTTNEAVAKVIAREQTRTTERTSALRVLTNCPEIEYLLADPSLYVNVIGLGGGLRKDTMAHAGELAFRSLNALGVHFDVALIGTTSVLSTLDRQPRAFMCDSEDEAIIKSKCLALSDCKSIIMDSTKLRKKTTSSFMFAQATSDNLDLVITDNGILADPESVKIWNGLWLAGIVVILAATGDEKEDHTARDHLRFIPQE
jgi:hypothetical protein